MRNEQHKASSWWTKISNQLLRAPPLAALSSSILAMRFLNSSYWHFSYECLSSYCADIMQRSAITHHRRSCTRDTGNHVPPKNVCRTGAEEVGEETKPRKWIKQTYLASPRKVVLLKTAAIERNQEMGATIAIGQGDSGVGHLLLGGLRHRCIVCRCY